nr:hypothetical protein [uncultured Flavobacterium sp.]
MRRIKVDNLLEKSITDFYIDLFDNNSNFSNMEEDLDNLKKTYRGLFNCKKREYITKLKDNLLDIVSAKPSRIKFWKDEFEKIIKSKKIDTQFHEKLVETLKYSQIRKFPILGLYKNIGINSCVYCNAQLSVVLDLEIYKNKPKKGQIKSRKALFELDHFHAKSKYPFLGISFFNLLPCCANCNKSKGKEDVLFYLFTEDDNDLDIFRFELDKLSVIKYWRSRNLNDIKINFNTLLTDDSILLNHNKYFKITQLYETQNDIAEELLHKKIAYSRAYKLYLEKDYQEKLFPDQAMINRLIIGNYDKPEETHKRPMAKFTQDIAKQLDLIK